MCSRVRAAAMTDDSWSHTPKSLVFTPAFVYDGTSAPKISLGLHFAAVQTNTWSMRHPVRQHADSSRIKHKRRPSWAHAELASAWVAASTFVAPRMGVVPGRSTDLKHVEVHFGPGALVLTVQQRTAATESVAAQAAFVVQPNARTQPPRPSVGPRKAGSGGTAV